MNRGVAKVLAFGVVLMCLSLSAQANTVTEGALSSSTSGDLTSGGAWTTGNGFAITWSATPVAHPYNGWQAWTYDYSISGTGDTELGSTIDNVLLQTSGNFTADDIVLGPITLNGNPLDSSDWAIATYANYLNNYNETGYPNSAALYGIKFDLSGMGLTSADISFTSDHVPTTGSFFASNGGTAFAYRYRTDERRQ